MNHKRKITPEQVAAIKMRQQQILKEFKSKQASSGRGMSSFESFGEPFTVTKKPQKKLTQKDLINLQRQAGGVKN